MPAKHQPDFAFLRHVPLRRVHLFTLVQVTCLAVLWILKSTVAAIIFPVMVRVCISLNQDPYLFTLNIHLKIKIPEKFFNSKNEMNLIKPLLD